MSYSLPKRAFRRRPSVVLALGVLSASCGKVGYDASELQTSETGASDASRDRATYFDVAGNPEGNVFLDGPGAGATFKVGSFVKSTAPGTQVVAHGLGQPPKALVLWTVGKTAAGPSPDYTYAFGVSDAPGSSRAIANASRNGSTPSNASRRMASRAITIVQWSEQTLAEADLASWDAASFTLAWPTNNPAPFVVHYIAIGGAGVSAKVVSWQLPTSPGTRSVAGFGFRPDTVLHLYSGALFLSPSPSSQTNGALGMGFFDATGNQCAYQLAVVDAQNPTITARALRSDAAIYMFSERPAPNVTKQGSFVSMDAGGFTLDFTAAETSPTPIFSLALAGVRAKVGAFDKPTSAAPLSQSVAGVGFEPGLVFLTSVADTAQSGGVSQPHALLATGVSDGKSQASAEFHDLDGIAPSSAFGADDTTHVFNASGTSFPGMVAQAAMSSLDPDGFSLAWSSNDAVATRICYWALGPP